MSPSLIRWGLFINHSTKFAMPQIQKTKRAKLIELIIDNHYEPMTYQEMTYLAICSEHDLVDKLSELLNNPYNPTIRNRKLK